MGAVVSGWFDRHEHDGPVPAAIDFAIIPIDGALVMVCPSCESELELRGEQMYGKVTYLIGDHIRTHQSQAAAFRWQP